MSGPSTSWEEVYRAQTARIEELERENAALHKVLSEVLETQPISDLLEVQNTFLRQSHSAIYTALGTQEVDCTKWPDQIRALRADKERLDWLETQDGAVSHCKYGEYRHYWGGGCIIPLREIADTMRKKETKP